MDPTLSCGDIDAQLDFLIGNHRPSEAEPSWSLPDPPARVHGSAEVCLSVSSLQAFQ